MIPQTRAATAVAAEAAVFAAEAVRKERNPVAAGSCSSRNKSSGTLKAPWAQTMAIPTMRAEIRTDPTLVRKTTTTLDTISIPTERMHNFQIGWTNIKNFYTLSWANIIVQNNIRRANYIEKKGTSSIHLILIPS